MFLIDYSILANHIATDGTYKLNYNNFPILLVGTTDFEKQFHPFGVMLTKNEDKEDYAFMFQSVKDLSEKIFEYDYEPTILLADAAAAITNGFELVFIELQKRIICWFHVSKAIRKYLDCVKDQKIKCEIYFDIVEFQHNISIEQFIPVARLMITKWQTKFSGSDQVDTFIKYFMKLL